MPSNEFQCQLASLSSECKLMTATATTTTTTTTTRSTKIIKHDHVLRQ